MTYKTLMLKIFKPTKAKQKIMDDAICRYSQALQFLLQKYRGDLISIARSDQTVSRSVLLKLIEKETLKQLNQYGVEPFKDSIKIEFAALSAIYITQFRKNRKVRFPCVFREALQTDQHKGGKMHPLYFGRYAENRDYCLMVDSNTGRYYAKLYLLNAKNKISAGEAQGKLQLNYLSENSRSYLQQSDSRRFIIVPLAFGKRQLEELNRLQEYPKLARTARLKKVNGEYYLLVNIACESKKVEVLTRMGIARSADGGLHYTVCTDSGDEVLESGFINPETSDCQKLYVLAKNIVRICRRHFPQVIVESGGGKNDRLILKRERSPEKKPLPLTITEYTKFVKILSYKLAEEGLPQPIALSANRLFTTCPACSVVSQKSRISPELFVCVECGYASDVGELGSMNLIRRLRQYKNDSVPVVLTRSRDKIIFTNRILGFEFTLPTNSQSFEPLYYEINRMVHAPFKEKIDSPKYAIIKKLKSAPNIAEAIRIMEKPSADNFN